MRKKVKYRLGYPIEDETNKNLKIKRSLTETEYRHILGKMNESIKDTSSAQKDIYSAISRQTIAIVLAYVIIIVAAIAIVIRLL